MAVSGARLLHGLALWLRNPHAELRRTASDLGVSIQGLKRIAARGPLNALLIEKMATAYGLDADCLRSVNVNTVREMEGCCTFCDRRFRCALDLSVEDGAARTEGYCANARTFEALRRGHISISRC